MGGARAASSAASLLYARRLSLFYARRLSLFLSSPLTPEINTTPSTSKKPTHPKQQQPRNSRLTDSQGRTVDFKNALIIMTSNVGARAIEQGGRAAGFFLRPDDEDDDDGDGDQAEGEADDASPDGRIKSLVNQALKAYFRPEFLNRLDEVVVFRQLAKKEARQIADLMLADVFQRASEQRGLTIEVTARFKQKVVDEGFSRTYGARPLRRAITRLVEDCLAERILRGEVRAGDAVVMDVGADGAVAVAVARAGGRGAPGAAQAQAPDAAAGPAQALDLPSAGPAGQPQQQQQQRESWVPEGAFRHD